MPGPGQKPKPRAYRPGVANCSLHQKLCSEKGAVEMSKRLFVSGRYSEIRAAIQEAEKLAAKPYMTKQEEVRVGVLLSKVKALQNPTMLESNNRQLGPESRAWFRGLLTDRNFKPEQRGTDMLAGTQSKTWSEGEAGGFAVPTEFFDQVLHGMAQADPLLADDVVTLIPSTSYSLQPMQLSGWDLSTIAASRIEEAQQKNPITVPAVDGDVLNGWTYKLALDASFELEEDAVDRLIAQIQAAYTVGFARGIGMDLVTGTGSSQPQGVLEGAANSSVTTAAATTLSLDDFTKIYFSVNRAYRANAKCAWLMNDATYQLVRQAVDSNSRPLLDIIGDQELLLGKPVLVSPTMPSGAGTKAIVFGDLSHYVVRVSQMRFHRSLQAAGYVEFGKALYTGLMRADAVVFDPTGGNTPPIVYATMHS
jgi:HK97 family phage major capsid protein